MKKTKSSARSSTSKAKAGASGMNGMMSGDKSVLVGAGVAALAAGLAGAYYFYGSDNAKKHRRQVKSWMLKAKGEVLEQIESLPEISEEIYKSVVKEVMNRYKTLKNVESSEMKDLTDELEAHWENIKKGVTKAVFKGKK